MIIELKYNTDNNTFLYKGYVISENSYMDEDACYIEYTATSTHNSNHSIIDDSFEDVLKIIDNCTINKG